jgi:Fe2+ or Zn2+ uptake regulation protein
MKTKEEEKYNQSRRILSIYRLILSQRKITTNEVIVELLENFPGISKRSIQRDLKILADEGYIVSERKGSQSCWKIQNDKQAFRTPVIIRESELLSFHILKTYLKTFKGTTIEEDINKLSAKLETMAPGDVFIEEQLR